MNLMATKDAPHSGQGADTAEPSRVVFHDVGLNFILYRNRSRAFREILLNTLTLKSPLDHESFWALRNISLTFRQGERVAILGRNGAGKSTLLKLIARIYEASVGRVETCGRIAPLIEMGAGFHPELSGLENIFLNGSILGFSRKQMKERIEKIIGFSELDRRFLDTPIKYYSSGMLMRLAFSVAAEVDPQILILDEIFAGGDAGFVEKAAARMMHLIHTAHIMILVTHDLSLARRLAGRCVWLDAGRVRADGPTAEVLPLYEAFLKGPSANA
jgi:ABC-type polysaccharide/polyol phosphate transport system ATPase subunit